MEYFDIIENGFNSADETINFGTRSIGYENLYEISTVACLKSSYNKQFQPGELPLKSLVHNGKICICIAHSFTMFEDKELSVILFNASFDADIEAFAISPNDRFLVTCLNSGLIKILDISQKSLIYEMPLEENKFSKCFTGCFMEKSDENVIHFIIVSCFGRLYRIIICLQNDAINSPNVSVSDIYNFSFQVNLCEFTFPKLFVNGGKACILDVDNMGCVVSDPIDIKKVYACGQKFLGLCHNGNLIRICDLTLLIFPIVDTTDIFEDILVVSDNNIMIVAVCKVKHNGSYCIQTLSYSDFKSIYSLNLQTKPHLTQLESSTDEIMFFTEQLKGDSFTELRFQGVFETEPELRVEKLIKKHRYEEAELFAKKFNVNPVIIKKAQAQQIIDKVICTRADIEGLLKLLEEIDDDSFKLQCCKLVDCSEVGDVRKILAYGSSLHIKSNLESREECLELQNALVDLLYKFDTFMSIHDSYEMDEWSSFTSADLIEYLKEFLQNGEIESAIILFSRLGVATMKKLTNEKIEEILFIINNLPTDLCMPFLPTFLTITIVQKPESLPVFVKWLHTKILILEKRQDYDFPDCGIKFAEHIIKLLKVDGQANMAFQRQCMLNKHCLIKLDNILTALKDIQNLKNNFRINIPLSKYLMGPKEVISVLLNIHLNPQEYDHLLNKFLYNFMILNQFAPDSIFLDEIKNLLKTDEIYWIGTVEVLLKYISSVEKKLTAIKEIMQNARVPWSQKIRSIGINALTYSHHLSAEIRKELENEHKLIILKNPKYGIKDKFIMDIKDLKFIVNRIMYKNEPTSVDDCLKLCKTPEEKHEVNILLIQNFIRKGETEKAISILNNNASEEIYKCAKWFSNYARLIIDNNNLGKLCENYRNIVGTVYSKVIDNTDNPIEKQQYNDELAIIRGVCSIRKNFNKNITSSDLFVPKIKIELCNKILQEVVENFQNGSTNLVEILRICSTLASSFSFDKNEIVTKFCEKVADFDIILQAAEFLLKNNCDARNLCLITVLLLKYISNHNSPKINFEDSTFNFLTPSNTDINNKDFIGGLEMAERLIKRAILTCSLLDHSAIVEVMNWVHIGFFVIRSKKKGLKADLFKNMYQPDSIIPGQSTFTAINRTFEIYCQYIEQFKHPNTRFLTNYYANIEPLSEEQFLMEIQNIIPMTNELCREGQHLTAYNLFIRLQKGLIFASPGNSDIKKIINAIIKKKCLPQLIHAVASAKYLDEVLFYNLLVITGKGFGKYINQYIKLFRHQPSKSCTIAKVGIKLMDNCNISNGRQELFNFIICCKWWKKVENSDINYDEFFKPDSKARLEEMMAANCMGIDDIKEYCNDFNLDTQICYIDYLSRVLRNWKPDIEYTTDICGKRSITIKNNEEILLKKCMEIIDVITSKEMVLKLIQKIWNKVNDYYYEVYICMLNIENKLQRLVEVSNIQPANSMKKLYLPMLLFLKGYRRISSSEHHQFSPFSDPLSEFRLPFTTDLFTSDIWNIIKPELNLKTYKQWFNAHYILKNNLTKDDICTYAVKDVVSSGILVQDPSVKWYLYPQYEDLFVEIKECVKHITDLERATATVYYLMNSMPCGADKVNVAQLNYDFALRYREKFPDSEEVTKTFLKVKQKYYSYSAVHILFMYQVADEKYLNLVGQPNDLINALYKDERITKKSKCINLNCPDINAAVDELSKLFDIDIQQIRYYIVKNCLGQSNSDIDFDSTCTIPCLNGNQTTSDDSLARAMYICTSGDITFWQDYLLSAGSEENDYETTDDSFEQKEPKSLIFKANALKCFCALSDVDTITRLTETTYNEFLDSVNTLILRSELEKFGFVMDLPTLNEYDKKELLQRLAKFGNQASIKVMGILSITYDIDDQRYWEFIVTRAISLGMIEELKLYVQFLRNKSFKKFHIAAWQAIINNLFNISEDLSAEEVYQLYLNNFLTIQSCPVLYSLNFENIIKKCLYFKQSDFAAVLLQYFPENEKLHYGKVILQTPNLAQKLEILKKNGIWGVRKANIILGKIAEKD